MAVLKITDSDRIREDVSDDITMLDDEKTCPMTDAIKRGEHPGNPLYEWPVEQYSSDTSLGTVYDAQPVLAADLKNNAANRGMLQGRTMMQRHAIGVGTKVQRGAAKPGIPLGNAYDHELAIGMVEIKRKVERAIVGAQNSVAEVGGTTGSQTRGVSSWIRNVNPASANDLPVAAANLVNTAQIIVGAVATVLLGSINTAMQTIWSASGRKGKRYRGLCSANMKTQVTSYMTDAAPISGHVFPVSFNGQVSEHKIEFYVDVVTTDWGTIEFEAHSFLNANDHFLGLLPEMMKIRPCFGVEHEKLPIDGSGERGFLETYWGLQVSDPTAFFCARAAAVA